MENILMTKLQAGGFVFLLGLFIVFFGMVIIVAVLSVIGAIMKKSDLKKAKKQAEPETNTETAVESTTDGDGLTDEIRAAIVAVISAYYFEQGNKCEFKVKKIKRI